MRRPELILGGILLAVAAFVGYQAARAPRRARAPAASQQDSVAATVAAAAAAADATSGLRLSHMRRSTLPPPPARDYADIGRRITDARGVTYLDDILALRAGNVARWVDRRENPITVWIAPRSGVRDFFPEFRERARDAFYTWGAAGVPLRFLFIDDSAAAEVRVRWVERFPDTAAGRTYWARDQNWWIVGADIELAVHRSTGEAFDSQMIHTIALHEVGHLIGLDHSRSTDDIMASRVRVTHLSAADLRTASLVYRLPPGPVAPPGGP